MVQVTVDLELISLGDIGRTGFKSGAVEDAAITAGHALEADGEFEILVMLFGHQVAVALGKAYAMNGAVLDSPLLAAHLHPSGEVFAVKERSPSFLRVFQAGLLGRGDACQGQGQNQSTHDYAPISLRIAVAMRSVNSSTRARSGPSTMTRASGSVPEKRTSTRPEEPKACWHSSISRATSASSWSARRSRMRTFCKRCG